MVVVQRLYDLQQDPSFIEVFVNRDPDNIIFGRGSDQNDIKVVV